MNSLMLIDIAILSLNGFVCLSIGLYESLRGLSFPWNRPLEHYRGTKIEARAIFFV